MTTPVDAKQRTRIRDDTSGTIFVNAGAGSGKTTALVNRVLTLVLRDGIRLANIAAVTFTEKAGAELRDRLRVAFEAARREKQSQTVDDALDDLDSAAIGTLHAYAARILNEHPIEAGLPPILEVLDEVGSSVAFDSRWAELQAELLDDDDMERPLLIGLGVGMKLEHVRTLALLLGKDWDLIEERILADVPPQVFIPDTLSLLREMQTVVEMARDCSRDDDKLLTALNRMAELRVALQAAPDDGTRLSVLSEIGNLKFSNGQRANWTCDIETVRTAARGTSTQAAAHVQTVQDLCLRQITYWLASRVLESADLRRREGRLEFHDLLVLARNVLRRHADVRKALSAKYQRLLLDEFQDSDPIQIELAARICGGEGADATRWQDITVPAGRLFVVGDAKQSIYRFRRASIRTYLDAQDHIGEPETLTTNFRTIAPILEWVNGVFSNVIQAVPGGQPEYVPLSPHRGDGAAGPAVTILGAEAHHDDPRAAELREREAADVAAVVRQALDERWQVHDEALGTWRDARHDDIAVLLPARTSLGYLEHALDAAGVSYRAEASSLVYQASEVRDLLACARAIADTSDSFAVVTALRSPLFGCGDDDLWRWKRAGGSFSVFFRLDDEELLVGPVGTGLRYLKRLYFDSRWLAPHEILTRIAVDRRMFEVAAAGARARDGWRRLRFVIDQARAWSEVAHGGLRAYLAWAAHQGQETSRVAEAVLPETDMDSVRIMTVHAAKGLEFPIVVMSGMTSQGGGRGGATLLWPPEGGYAARLTKAMQTGTFEVAKPVDEQMDELEKFRLLYVAATRARDHLVVSLHRAGKSSAKTAAKTIAEAGGDSLPGVHRFEGFAFAKVDTDGRPAAQPPPDYAQWSARIEAARARTRVVPAITASGLEGTEPDVVLDEREHLGLAKGPRDLDLPPWTKGRYGSAIGRAVHAVLQVVDLATGDGFNDAVAAQCIVEGVAGEEQLVHQLVQSALNSDLVRRAAVREHWRETYVGTMQHDGILLEGYIDLVFREDDGSLMVVDYKTDAVPSGAISSRVTYYKPQMDAYRKALSAATGATVTTTLLFLHPENSRAEPA